jgi:hypothetical protein
MTDQDKQAYARAIGVWQARAKKLRGHITHVHWRDGRMTCWIEPGKPAPLESAPEPSSRRGAIQETLL